MGTPPSSSKPPMVFSSKVKPHLAQGTLLEYLCGRFAYHTQEEWRENIRSGRIVLNGAPAVPEARLQAGDRIDYDAPQWQEPEANVNYRIVYEDECLIVVDKPANLMVHAAGRIIRNTLIFHLRYANPSTLTYGASLKLVNRLDRDTSGLIAVAKDDRTLAALHRQFVQRQVEKRYVGIVFGRPAQEKFTVDLPVGAHPRSAIKTKLGPNPEGKAARTDFTVRETAAQYTLLEIHPITGRTNQIRIHLEATGFPLVGDKLYSGSDESFLEWCEHGTTNELLARLKMPRQALHASYLAFNHPADGRRLEVASPLPADMADFWSSLSS